MPRWQHAPWVLGLGLLCLVVYANSFGAGFVLDNRLILLEDPRLEAATWENLQRITTEDYWWPHASSGLYRPLTTLTYLGNHLLGGERPFGYHLVNLLLHWLNTCLVFALALRLTARRGDHDAAAFAVLPFAVGTAALFAVHPIATEAVTNIVGRADLLATAATLGALWLYTGTGSARSGARNVLAGGVALAGVFCKESAIVVVPLAALVELTAWLRPTSTRSPGRRSLRLIATFGPAVAALAVARWRLLATHTTPIIPFEDNPLAYAEPLTRVLSAFKILGAALARLVWPSQLCCDYSFDAIPLVHVPLNGWGDWQAVAVIVLTIVLGVAAVRSWLRGGVVGFLIACFVIVYLPTSNLLLPIGSIMADRFLYLPSAPLAALFVLGALRLQQRVAPTKAGAVPVLLVLVVAALGARTLVRNGDWRSDVRLWASAARTCPGSFKAHKSLAHALATEGAAIDEVISIAERARAIAPDVAIAHHHLGGYYRQKGDAVARGDAAAARRWYAQSLVSLERAATLDRHRANEARRAERQRGWPTDRLPPLENPDIAGSLGRTLERLGRHADAYDAYRTMHRLAPADPRALAGLATTAAADGRTEDTVLALVELLVLAPGSSEAQSALPTLARLYPRLDGGGCAIATDGGRAHIVPTCPLVRKHLCRAFTRLASAFAAAGDPDTASRVAAAGHANYGCTPSGPT